MSVSRIPFLVIGCLLASFAAGASASCGGSYVVKSGDTLSRIAQRTYGDARKWTVIYNTNLQQIGTNPHLIQVGMEFRLACLEPGTGPTAAGGVPEASGKDIRLLTASDYQPFSDRSLLNGGLVTDVVTTALERAPQVSSFGVGWVDDWSRHLDPLLSGAEYDMGFPWLRPDCRQSPENPRCRDFLFSEPMFEMLILLFTDARQPLRFVEDGDILGKTLCRPAGYYTHDLEKDGRRWLSSGKVDLLQPETVEACFEALLDGRVDAVAVNEFTGRSVMEGMGLANQVKIVQSRPLAIEGLHVLVHRQHPRAQALIRSVNQGLAAIKESGEYQRIVDRHLGAYWSQF